MFCGEKTRPEAMLSATVWPYRCLMTYWDASNAATAPFEVTSLPSTTKRWSSTTARMLG